VLTRPSSAAARRSAAPQPAQPAQLPPRSPVPQPPRSLPQPKPHAPPPPPPPPRMHGYRAGSSGAEVYDFSTTELYAFDMPSRRTTPESISALVAQRRMPTTSQPRPKSAAPRPRPAAPSSMPAAPPPPAAAAALPEPKTSEEAARYFATNRGREEVRALRFLNMARTEQSASVYDLRVVPRAASCHEPEHFLTLQLLNSLTS